MNGTGANGNAGQARHPRYQVHQVAAEPLRAAPFVFTTDHLRQQLLTDGRKYNSQLYYYVNTRFITSTMVHYEDIGRFSLDFLMFDLLKKY